MTDDKKTSAKSEPWYWMRGDKGVASVSATLVFVSFLVTTVAYLFSTVEGIGDIKFREFDVAACSAYFVPILTLYFGRKWTDVKVASAKLLER